MFEALYLINQSIVMGIYSRSKKVPPYVILLLASSKRFHSIFLLRCFNDPVAMSFMYACILAMTYRRWTLSTVLFSCALSIKMNVLLFFPAFGILLWLTLGAWKTVGQLGLLAMTQVSCRTSKRKILTFCRDCWRILFLRVTQNRTFLKHSSLVVPLTTLGPLTGAWSAKRHSYQIGFQSYFWQDMEVFCLPLSSTFG